MAPMDVGQGPGLTSDPTRHCCLSREPERAAGARHVLD